MQISAAVVAATIAAVVATVSLIVQAVSDSATRKQVARLDEEQRKLQKNLASATDNQILRLTNRDHRWVRFSWGLEKAVSSSERESEAGLTILIAMLKLPWATVEENGLAAEIAGLITDSKGLGKKK